MISQTTCSGDRAWSALTLAAFALALTARLVFLGSVPPLFFHDEADNTRNVANRLRIGEPSLFGLDWKPQPAIGVQLQALSIRALGPSLFSLRFPTSLVTALCVLPFMAILRRRTSLLAASLAAWLLVLDLGFLHFSRTAWENAWVAVPLLGIVLLLGTPGPARRRPAAYLVCGMLVGLAADLYFGGRVVVVALVLYAFAEPGQAWRHRFAHVLLVAAGWWVLVGPYWYFHPNLFLDPRTRVVAGGALSVFSAERARGMLLLGAKWWVVPVETDRRYFPSDRPILNLSTLLLVITGVVAARRRKETALALLVIAVSYSATWFVSYPVAHFARFVFCIPLVYLFAAFGLDRVLAATRPPVLRALVCILIVGQGALSCYQYFSWAGSSRMASVLQPGLPPGSFKDFFDQRMAGK